MRCGCELDGCVVCCSDSTCGNVWNKVSIMGCNDVGKLDDLKFRRGHPSGDEHGGCVEVMPHVATEKIALCSAWHVAVGSVINHRCVYSQLLDQMLIVLLSRCRCASVGIRCGAWRRSNPY